jgi:DNA-binding response OmpR family regulator
MSSILCIEDDQETASLLAEALGELGFAVELASNGEDAFQRILVNRPDLALCDVRMPLGGFELLERLSQAGPAFGNLPFIFLTALGDRDNELAGRRLGADDYLTKPIDFEMLGASWRIGCGEPTAAPVRILTCT